MAAVQADQLSEAMSGEPLDIVLISTSDWDNPFWTNKQHVATELARLGHKVLYVESQGLRRPTATARDLKRIWRRLGRAIAGPRKVGEHLWVWSPLAIPLQNNPLVRSVNRLILTAGLKICEAVIGLRPRVLWTYSPLTTRLFATNNIDLLVYHAVDDMKRQPGMPFAAIVDAEQELTRRADIVFATSQNLFETHISANPSTYYFPNVADYDHFAMAMSGTVTVPADLQELPRPRLGFVGAITSYKLDLALIEALARARPDWSIVLIGEVGEGDPWTKRSDLPQIKNLHILGPRSYAELPAYLSGFDVALLPNVANEYTRSMFPMKFFEYLAAGLPIVSTRLPALAAFEHVAKLCIGPEQFIAAIQATLEGQTTPLEDRLAVAKKYTYAKRQSEMMAIVEAKLASIAHGRR